MTGSTKKTRAAAVIGLLATALAAAGVTSAGASPAAFPGGNGGIAFETWPVGGAEHDIKTVGGVNLTPNPGPVDRTPSYGPSGQRIVWARDENIWVMHADGSSKKQLTSNTALERTPTFSPDGQRIAYQRGQGIWVMRADGSRQHRVVRSGFAPSWSPDGHWIAFYRSTSLTPADRIYKVHPSGKGLTNLSGSAAGDDFDPDWSPDGSRIAFTHETAGGTDEDILVMHADGTHRTGIVTTAAAQYDPAYAPNGKAIAYLQDGSSWTNVWRVNLGTGLRTNLTQSTVSYFAAPTWQPV